MNQYNYNIIVPYIDVYLRGKEGNKTEPRRQNAKKLVALQKDNTRN